MKRKPDFILNKAVMRGKKLNLLFVASHLFVVATLFLFIAHLNTANGETKNDGGMKPMRETRQETLADVLPPGIDPILLPEPESKGAQLLQRYCTQCHYLPGPGRHTVEEWPTVIKRMKAHIDMRRHMHKQMKGGIADPTESQFKLLTHYLQTYAQKPMAITRHPDLDTAAGKSFTTTCSQCHVLPDPKQHTAQEWPAVVGRMQEHIFTMHKTVADEAMLKRILAFLQRHGRIQH